MYYVHSNKEYYNPNFPKNYFDFIFVDGKERIKCMISSLKLLKNKEYLMLHDSNRTEYSKGIKLFQKIEEKDNTILLSKKTKNKMYH